MSFGIFVYYLFAINLLLRHESLLSAAASIQPFTLCAVFAALLSAFLIPRLAAQYILAIGATSMLVANIILVTMPAQQSYWHAEFFAVAIAAFSPDLIFTAAQIIASNSVGKKEQGVAGSLVGTLLTFGVSTGLGFGGVVEVHTNRGGADLLRGYRGALWLAVGMAGASLVIGLISVRIVKDKREGWEKEEGNGEVEMSGVTEA